jgi:phosphatidylinositol alpha-1,6-mannosyltransferase
MKAAVEVCSEMNINFKAVSLHDAEGDTRYVDPSLFKGFGSKRINFVFSSLFEGLLSDLVILAHINLAPIGVLIKKLKRKVPVILITHGIDVWYKLSKIKLEMIKCADNILSVSNFTKQRLIKNHNAPPQKISVFADTIDPYFTVPSSFEKPKYLMDRLGIDENTKVILTVSRLSSQERRKGYDKVIQTLPGVIKKIPDVIYIIVGKGNKDEVTRIKLLIKELGLNNNVILTDYVSDEELPDYYMLCDVFILPSGGEGFGIVFLEALACGKIVIAGNQDASSEVLKDGELGILINPDNICEIETAIINALKKDVPMRLNNGFYLKEKAFELYGFNAFKKQLSNTIKSVQNSSLPSY